MTKLLEMFPKLTDLELENIQIYAADSSIVTSLEFEANELPSVKHLTVERCATMLSARLTNLTGVLHTRFFNNPNLQQLQLPSGNLEYVDCRHNHKLFLLDVSNRSTLKKVDAVFNSHLRSLDATSCVNLAMLTCCGNRDLVDLMLDGCDNMHELHISSSHLLLAPINPLLLLIQTLTLQGIKIPLGPNPLVSMVALKTLTLIDSNIECLSLPRTSLVTAILSCNPDMTVADFSSCTDLKIVSAARNNVMTALMLSGCTNLEQLTVKHHMKLISLDLSNTQHLKDLMLSHVELLDTVDLQDKPYLSFLKMSAMNLTGNMDLSASTQLQRAHFKHCGQLKTVTIRSVDCRVVKQQCMFLREI